jgi:hypothetical protein
MSSYLQTKLKSDMELRDLSSTLFDGSTDISEVTELAFMVRMVFTDVTVTGIIAYENANKMIRSFKHMQRK